MKAILLAAGLGIRLLPLTARRPKCMVPVAGKPVLQRNIEWLRRQGITDMVVNLHHYPEVVKDYFRDGGSFGVNLHYSYEPELLGTAGALWAARQHFLQEPFLVVYADNLIACDLGRLSSLHVEKQAALTLALFWRDDVSASGVAELDVDKRVISFKEKPGNGEVPSHWVNAGLLLCEPKILGFIPPGQVSDFGHEILPALLVADERLFGYTMGPGEGLHWIDTPDDLVRTKAILREEV